VRTGVRDFFYEVRQDDGTWPRLWGNRTASPSRLSVMEAGLPQQSYLERARNSFCNSASMLGAFVSGALGGMAVITILQTYLFRINDWAGQTSLLLQFYAPIAVRVNRLYFVLIVVALSSSVSRSAATTTGTSDAQAACSGHLAWHGCATQTL
jgi:hypothetical protein